MPLECTSLDDAYISSPLNNSNKDFFSDYGLSTSSDKYNDIESSKSLDNDIKQQKKISETIMDDYADTSKIMDTYRKTFNNKNSLKKQVSNNYNTGNLYDPRGYTQYPINSNTQQVYKYHKPLSSEYNNHKVYIKQNNDSGYFSKLFSKKKDILKIIQLSLIITLGICLYYFMDYYINLYINTNDFNSDRQFIIKLLFPVFIIFLIWNLKIYNIK